MDIPLKILASVFFTIVGFGTLVTFFTLFALPGVGLCLIGWKLSGRVANNIIRTFIRAGLISIAFAPTFYGHAGLVSAIWIALFGYEPERFKFGVAPLLAVWLITIAIIQWKAKKGAKGKG